MENEIWQVEVNGQIYEANFEELKQWIAERALLPEDKVRKGNLRWTQANQIPSLKLIFDRQNAPAVAPPPPKAPPAAKPMKFEPVVETPKMPLPLEKSVETPPSNFSTPPQAKSGNHCHFHRTERGVFVCRECSNVFCKSCPKNFGAVRICPLCGEMCDPLTVNQGKTKKNARHRNAVIESFGLMDFIQAWVYPFKFWRSLGFGALFVALLSFGGFYFNLLANMVLFSCISQTIGQVAHGNQDESFMSALTDFNELSIIEDILKPFLLSIGVFIVSWLPLAALLFLLFFNVLNSISNPTADLSERRINASANANALANSPTTQILLGQRNANYNSLKSDDQTEINSIVTGEKAAQQRQEAQRIQETIAASYQIKGEEAKAQHELMSEMFLPLLRASTPLILLCVAAFLWGVFYSPIALAIAGYTRSFLQTINPLVGMDTISKMGSTYLIAFIFVILVQIIGVVTVAVIGFMLSGFDSPSFGNLPAKFFGGVIWFYLALVIAFILGSALYKTSDRLGIQPD